jgi:hypothetical protein
VIISHSRRFVYVHLHKTAGESITSTLQPVLAPDDLVLRSRETAEFDGVRLDKHSGAREIRSALPPETWDRYFEFAFVRHPVDRTVSLYRWAAQRARPPRLTLTQRIGLRPAPERPDRSRNPEVRACSESASISEFIRHPLMDRARSMQPQSASLCDDDGALLVDFVGRFERLDEDFARVADTVGCPELSLKWRNASRGPHLSFDRRNDRPFRHHGRDELSDDDVRYLTARFEEDFRRFGYDA